MEGEQVSCAASHADPAKGPQAHQNRVLLSKVYKSDTLLRGDIQALSVAPCHWPVFFLFLPEIQEKGLPGSKRDFLAMQASSRVGDHKSEIDLSLPLSLRRRGILTIGSNCSSSSSSWTLRVGRNHNIKAHVKSYIKTIQTHSQLGPALHRGIQMNGLQGF